MKLFIRALLLAMLAPVLHAQVTITNMYVSASTSSTATIVWTTNVAASSQLKYGTDASLPYANNTNYTLTTSHSMTLTLLSPAYLYYVAAVSTDNSGHTTQSSTINFGLCGQPFVPTSGTVNNYYEYGSFTMTWQPPTGSSGTPTVCGLPMNTTITGALSGGASLSAEVPDAYRVIPGPGTWQITATDVGNLSPITITNPISATSNDLSAQLQAAAPAAGLTAVIANTINHTVYPSFICTTFSGCGSGTVTPAAQFSIPYYSVSPTGNTIAGSLAKLTMGGDITQPSGASLNDYPTVDGVGGDIMDRAYAVYLAAPAGVDATGQIIPHMGGVRLKHNLQFSPYTVTSTHTIGGYFNLISDGAPVWIQDNGTSTSTCMLEFTSDPSVPATIFFGGFTSFIGDSNIHLMGTNAAGHCGVRGYNILKVNVAFDIQNYTQGIGFIKEYRNGSPYPASANVEGWHTYITGRNNAVCYKEQVGAGSTSNLTTGYGRTEVDCDTSANGQLAIYLSGPIQNTNSEWISRTDLIGTSSGLVVDGGYSFAPLSGLIHIENTDGVTGKVGYNFDSSTTWSGGPLTVETEGTLTNTDMSNFSGLRNNIGPSGTFLNIYANLFANTSGLLESFNGSFVVTNSGGSPTSVLNAAGLTTPSATISGLTANRCVHTTTGGLLAVTAADCATAPTYTIGTTALTPNGTNLSLSGVQYIGMNPLAAAPTALEIFGSATAFNNFIPAIWTHGDGGSGDFNAGILLDNGISGGGMRNGGLAVPGPSFSQSGLVNNLAVFANNSVVVQMDNTIPQGVSGFTVVDGSNNWLDFSIVHDGGTSANGSTTTVFGRFVDSGTGLASLPAGKFNGTWFAGGSSTTTKPLFLIEPAGTTSTGWNTNGTGLGVNAASGFTGYLADLQLNGVTKFHVDSTGLAAMGTGSTVNGSLICTAAGVTGCAAGSGTVNSGTIDGIAYYTGTTAVSSTTAPTTSGHVFVPCWQPTGSVIAPTVCDFTNESISPGFSSLAVGPNMSVTNAGAIGTTAQVSASYFQTSLAAPTPGTSCAGNLIVTSAGFLYTCNGSIWIASNGTPATWAAGTGVTSVTCADAASVAVTCTSASGSLIIVGGTATTGTIATATWTAEPSKRKCSFTMNGNGSTGTAGFDIGHTAPTTTGVGITAGLTVLGATIFVDYACTL